MIVHHAGLKIKSKYMKLTPHMIGKEFIADAIERNIFPYELVESTNDLYHPDDEISNDNLNDR